MAITTMPKSAKGGVAASKPRASRRHLLRETAWGYLFLLPVALLYGTFVLYPNLGSIRYALYNWDGIGIPDQFVGLRHFVETATDPYFWNAFLHTIIYTIAVDIVQLGLALVIALALSNPRLRGNAIYRAAFFLPSLTTPAIVALSVRQMILNVTQAVPHWMIQAGLFDPETGILNDPRYAFPAVIAFGIWLTLGYNIVYFLAALQTVPPELYEAARIDGAGRFSRLRFITLPMIRPVGAIILLLATSGSLGVFDAVFILTGGGPFFSSDVVSTYIYARAFGTQSNQIQNIGIASSAALFFSFTLLMLAALNTFLLVRLRRQQRDLISVNAAQTA